MAHTHNAIWRINMRITESSAAGSGATNVSIMRHIGNPDRSANWQRTQEVWRDEMVPFNGGREGSLELNPKQFTALHVRSIDRKNARGSPSGYMIMPLYRGVPRHKEPFLRKDIWVTQFKDPGVNNNFAEDDVRCLEAVETFAAGQGVADHVPAIVRQRRADRQHPKCDLAGDVDVAHVPRRGRT